MKKSLVGQMNLAVATLLAASLLFVGCSSKEPAPETTPESVGTFTGQSLPAEVQELTGTPLYTVSPDLAKVSGLKEACYLLIAPQDPTKALLIVEAQTKSEDVAKRESAPITLAGKKELMKLDKLVEHVKQNYDLEVQADESGQVEALRVEAPKAEKSEGQKEGE